ncbi:phosphatase PAP2 family protein [Allobranchiibius sp. GilTou73]|uniref:phosphatase PAP2 family protein n=1 Tax=Allobranchiibius sp. GilTou73 TaxID=2904523 RepID=UPI001F247590|nr:phosphatase PAP2 family protein [Allobranchiibius sp. GilTou73]UIJ34775.1 phosphatase PAP2 family protein [Allobranchiibius sp. GilTou73]
MSASTMRPTGQQTPPRPRTSPWRPAAAMVGVAVVAIVVLVMLLVRNRTGAKFDYKMEFALGGPPWLFYNIEDRLQQVSVTSVALAGILVAAVALSRRRIGLAVGAIVLIGGATVTTQLLKAHVIHELPGDVANSMPSGHATVGISISLAVLMVLPVAWQWCVLPVCAAAGFFFGAGTVVGHWHHPGDVLAALAVCLAWAGVALAVAHTVDHGRLGRAPRTPSRPVRSIGPGLAIWLVIGGIALVSCLFLAWGAQPTVHGLRDLVLGMTAVALVAAGTVVVYGWFSQVARRYLV